MVVKYFVDNTQIHKLDNSSLPTKISKEKHIISRNGLFKLNGDKIIRFKLKHPSYSCWRAFPNSKNNTYYSEIIWEPVDNVHYIPYKHFSLEIQKTEYIIDSELKFIIEENKNKIIDYYFQTNKLKPKEHLKEDFVTFLSLFS
uniref:DUF402 domain-containing protein n=1 Tax=uncultured marine group II/III euryarchaeote AD1000_88_G11 TaxID=1457822 RepID=A0A075G569_9EURY|nr:hypothetical protein [uncultured marine group II/III euryarchaeote AD1000_88_G11]